MHIRTETTTPFRQKGAMEKRVARNENSLPHKELIMRGRLRPVLIYHYCFNCFCLVPVINRRN